MIIILIVLALLIPLFIGSIFLQIKLSSSENKWLGLIIPGCIIGFSIVMMLFALFGVAAYTTKTDTSSDSMVIESHTYNMDGEEVEVDENGRIIDFDFQTFMQVGFQMLSMFVLFNLGTPIYLGIYFYQRSRIKKGLEIEKMNIQDL